MATIERRVLGDGTTAFRVRVRLKGARVDSATFKRKTDAQRWAQSTEAAIREGRYFKNAESRRFTVADALDRYEREVLPLKPRTAKFQVRQIAWWRRELGPLLLADLTASAISAARAKLMSKPGARGSARGPSTANRYMAVLSHMLSVAVREWEWLDSNPATKLTKLREPRGRERFLSEDECARLLAACRAQSSDLHDVVVLAISTGMRRNEILWLRRSQIDITRGFIYLEDTKNRERRGVPVAGPALECMRDRLNTPGSPDQLCFAGRTGKTPFDIRKMWYRSLHDAQLRDLRFHDLRHTAASFLAKNGASLPEIGAVLGHKTPVMTKRYSHFAGSHLLGVVSNMNDRLFARIAGDVT